MNATIEKINDFARVVNKMGQVIDQHTVKITQYDNVSKLYSNRQQRRHG